MVTSLTPKHTKLLPQLLLYNPLSQLELDDFHILRPVKNPIRITRFYENPQSSEAESNDDRKQQSDADESEDRQDDIAQ